MINTSIELIILNYAKIILDRIILKLKFSSNMKIIERPVVENSSIKSLRHIIS